MTGHQETLDAQKKQKGSGSILGEIGSSVGGFINKLTGTTSPVKTALKSPKKKSGDEISKKRFTPWDLPEVDSNLVNSFAQTSGIAA